MQYALFDAGRNSIRDITAAPVPAVPRPFKQQLLKWIGNKQRFAHEIASYFPAEFGKYFEPFLGSGAVLGTLSPPIALGSDCFAPLIQIWKAVKQNPERLIEWYAARLALCEKLGKEKAYEEIKASYNANPNPADFVFLSRACYGGVVRFRRDGYMSTPCGPHAPVDQESFRERVYLWHLRVKRADFECFDYREAMDRAQPGDMVYCDPPYSFTQAILYGAQAFSLPELLQAISRCKERGVSVALSIDGSKKSGQFICDVAIPTGLFEREVGVNVGRSMLRRFQREGDTLEDEVVHDRLLLTY
jgi:DNA adenine methylase